MNFKSQGYSDVTELFQTNSKLFDTPKKLNRANSVQFESEILDKIENHEFTLEMIETMSKQVPIFKYKTCLTIHGHFNLESVPRIGGYKSLIQNKNGSLEVRWSAIDSEKRKRITRLVRKDFSYYQDSQQNYFCKIQTIKGNNYQDVLDEFRAIESRVMKTKFYGRCYIYAGNYWGVKFLCIKIYVNAIHEKEIHNFVANLNDENVADVAKRESEILEAIRLYNAEQEAKENKRIELRLHAENLQKEYQSQISHLPGPLVEVGNVLVEANFAVNYDSRKACFTFYRIKEKKGFGKFSFEYCIFVDKNFSELDLTGATWKEYHKAKVKQAFEKAKTFEKASNSLVNAKLQESNKNASTAKETSKVAVSDTASNVKITRNQAKNGIELRFAQKPSQSVLDKLKSNQWRWSKFGYFWYNRYTENNLSFAESLNAN